MESYARPAWTLSVDGADISARIAERLISLTLTDNRGFEADQLDVDLDDSDGKLDLPPKGAVLRLALGWEGAKLVDKGTYTVDELEHSGAPDKLTIRARSADLRSGLTTQRERSFHGKTIGEIVRTIAAENDLIAAVSMSLSERLIEHIDQTNESSANLLTRLARLHDAVASIKNDRLMFIHAGRGTSASGRPLPAVLIERKSGDSHRFGIADRDSFTHVRATYNDTGRGEKGEVVWGKTEDAAENTRKTPVAAPRPEAKAEYLPVGKRPAKSRSAALRFAHKEWKRRAKDKAFHARYAGVEVAYDDRNLKTQGKVTYGRADAQKQQQSAAQARDSTLPPQVAIDHSADNIKTLRHVYASKENAKHAARAEWRKAQRGVATFSITLASGRPELIPELPATVHGWKPAIDGTDWLVSRVVHNLTDAGYTTAVELEIRATEVPG